MKHLTASLLVCSALLASGSSLAADAGTRYAAFAGFRLGQQDLAGVQAALGEAPLKHSGQSGNSEYSVCYALTAGTVTFKSGELGGPSHQLLGFEVSSLPAAPSCAAWPTTRAAPSLRVAGIAVGMPRGVFVRTVGRRIEWRGPRATVSYLTHGRAGGKPTDILVTLEARFDADRIESFSVWRLETT